MIAEPIPILSDNYVWCLRSGADAAEALVVDPGDAAPVSAWLHRAGLQLAGILVTHWHPDHIEGIAALRAEAGPVPVYGPAAEAARIPLLTHPLDGNEVLDLPVGQARVMALPGHTLGHIGYVINGWAFCGDTLFSAGCGRLFEGTPAQMHASLQGLAALPDDTRVACTHEYTLANLAFAAAVEPDNPAVQARIDHVKALRAAGRPSLPTTVAEERQFNPFLRCHVAAVRAAAAHLSETPLDDDTATFAALRKWKDHFRAT
jgi:hydroxyacylglutathione hydrolase